MVSKMLSKLRLPEDRFYSVVRRFFIALILMFVPLVQFYSFLLALPLTELSSFVGFPLMSGRYWYAAFIWMYPSSPTPVVAFSIYFFILFYVIERWVPRLGLRLFKSERKSERE